ncbi:MAG: hypothetical protein AAF497_10285 [Planctomycetota bacterium]
MRFAASILPSVTDQMRYPTSRRAKRARTSPNSLSMSVEPLENRLMLAGNVVVKVLGNGNISITGDNSANQISIESSDSGDLLITGLSGTQITYDRVAADSQTISIGGDGETNRDLIIRMRNGNDEVSIENLDVRSTLNVNMSSGNDTLDLDQVNVGSVRYTGGSGGDTVTTSFLDVRGDTNINLGSASGATPDFAHISLSTLNGKTTLRGSGGETRINVVSSDLNKETTIATGSGDDRVEFLDSTTRGVKVQTSSGNDSVLAGLTTFNGKFENILSSGDDTVSFTGPTSANSAVFNGGGRGNDRVEFASIFLSTSGSVTMQSIEAEI